LLSLFIKHNKTEKQFIVMDGGRLTKKTLEKQQSGLLYLDNTKRYFAT